MIFTIFSDSEPRKSKFFIPEFKRWFCNQILGEKTTEEEINAVRRLLDMRRLPNDMPWCAIGVCIARAVSIFFGKDEKYPWTGLTGLEIIPVLNSSLDTIHQFDEGILLDKIFNMCKDMTGNRILQVLKDINEVFGININPSIGLSIIVGRKGESFYKMFKNQLVSDGVPNNNNWHNHEIEAALAFDHVRLEFEKEQAAETAMSVSFRKRKHNSYKSNSKKKREITCYYCHKPGHVKKDCFKWQAKMKQLQDKRDGAQKESDEEADLVEEVDCNKEDIMNTVEEIKNSNAEFILDSGATCHVVNDKDLFVTQEPAYKIIKGATGSTVAKMTGNVKCGNIILENAIYLPQAAHNVVSLKKLFEKGYEVEWNKDEVLVKHDNERILEAKNKNGFYIVQNPSSEIVLETLKGEDILSCHKDYGHASANQLYRIIKMTRSAKASKKLVKEVVRKCPICAGQTKLKHGTKEAVHASKPGERLCVDVMGPIDGKYGLTMTDSFSKFMIGSVLESRSEVSEKTIDIIKKFINLLRLTNRYPTFLRSDNEFRTKELAKFCEENGIIQEFTAAHSSYQNGRAERTNYEIESCIKKLTQSSGSDIKYWTYAYRHAIFLNNILPKNRSSQCPLGVLKDAKVVCPRQLLPFGCKVFCYNYDRKQKLAKESYECAFLGYGGNQVIPTTSQVIALRLFDNKVIRSSAFSSIPWSFPISGRNFLESMRKDDRSKEQVQKGVVEPKVYDKSMKGIAVTDNEKQNNVSVHNKASEEIHLSEDVAKVPQHKAINPNALLDIIIHSGSRPISLRRRRIIEHDAQVWSQDCKNDRVLTADGRSESVNLLVTKDKYDIPATYSEALESAQKDKWITACNSELQSFKKNKAYREIPIWKMPKNSTVITGRWVFNVKKEPGGERFKARVVAKGFRQEHGLNYAETYAPVMKLDSFRFVLAYAAIRGWSLRQLDAKNAFLNGKIDYPVYFKPPEGVPLKKGHVWKLERGVYGLKQAPRLWYNTIRKVLNSGGFQNSEKDNCIFYKDNCILVVYVDDILIAGKGKKDLDFPLHCLSKRFTMTDLGDPQIFLGMTLNCQRDFIKLSAKDTIERIIKNLQIELPEKKSATPVPLAYKLFDENSKLLDPEKQTEYRSMIGMLLYISNTVRFDIAYHVSILAGFVNTPREIHYRSAIKVVQYLGQTKDKGIILKKNGTVKYSRKDFQFLDTSKEVVVRQYPVQSQNRVTVYCDADWGKSGQGRSQSGGIVTFCGNVISWYSRKQKSVALSTAESELMSIREGVTTGKYFFDLLNEIGITVQYINLCCDNRAALTLSSHNADNGKSRHINISYFYIRDLVEKRICRLWYINGKDNPADIFTKRLSPGIYSKVLHKLIR